MKTTAEIEVIYEVGNGPLWRQKPRYEWKGPRNGMARLDMLAWWSKDLMELPWPVKVIARDHASASVFVARTDGFLRLTWLRHAIRYQGQRIWQGFNQRLVWTLIVWDIARLQEGNLASWHNLRWFWQRKNKGGVQHAARS